LSCYNVDVDGDANGFLGRIRRGNELKMSVGSTIVTRTRVTARGRPHRDVRLVLELDDGLYPSLRKLNLRWTPGDWYFNLGNLKASLPHVTLPMDMRSQFSLSCGRSRKDERMHLSFGRLTTQFKRDAFFGDETEGPYFLASELIVSGSETVRIDNEQVFRGTDYSMDFRHGTITFQRPVRESERVTVDYEYDSFFGVGRNRISGAVYRRRITPWLVAGLSGAYQRTEAAGGTGTVFLDHGVSGLVLELAPPKGGGSVTCEAARSVREQQDGEQQGRAVKVNWNAAAKGVTHSGRFESYTPGFFSVGRASEIDDRKLLQLGVSRHRSEGMSWNAAYQDHSTVQDRQTELLRNRELGSASVSFRVSRRRRMVCELAGESERWRDIQINPLYDQRRENIRAGLKWRINGALWENLIGWEQKRDLAGGGAGGDEHFAELSVKGRPVSCLVTQARARRTDVNSTVNGDAYRNLYHLGCQTERLFTCRLDGAVTMTDAAESPAWRELVSRISLDSVVIKPLTLEARYENKRKEVPVTGAHSGSSAWTGAVKYRINGKFEAEASYGHRSTAGQSWRRERIGKVHVRYQGFKQLDLRLGRETYQAVQADANKDYDGSVAYLQAMMKF